MKYFLLFAVALMAILGVGISTGACTVNEAAICLATLTLGSFAITDATLKVTKALPTGASAVTSDAIDLGHGTTGRNVADFEMLLTVPILATGVLGDAATMKYDIVTSANSDLSSPTVVAKEVLVQTGAGGAGAAANTVRYRLPTNCQRYVGAKCTKSSSGDASASSMSLELKF